MEGEKGCRFEVFSVWGRGRMWFAKRKWNLRMHEWSLVSPPSVRMHAEPVPAKGSPLVGVRALRDLFLDVIGAGS